jgi:hypothetical protein
MKLLKLNSIGIKEFRNYLNSLPEHQDAQPPVWLLEESSATEKLGEEDIDVDVQKRFLTRFDAAEYFYKLISQNCIERFDKDVGLWSWLTLLYFEQVCPVNKGRRVRRSLERYILESDSYKHYYRHILAGPYLIYKAHRDCPKRALVLLCQPLHKHGDVVEQLASRQELVTNPGIIEAATKLYYDENNKCLKKQAQNKDNGSVRRLVDVLNQYDLTYDLYAMSAEEILKILPQEFDRFKKRHSK